MKKDRALLFTAISFLVILLLAYANHFDNSFHFDDSHTIVDNVHIRTLKNIPDFFHDPTMFSVSTNHQSIRPLVTTTLAIDYWLAGGLHPWMFHLSTFLWHIGLAIMLYFMYKQLISKTIDHKWVPYIAVIGAGWFAIHTVMAETINYVISRSDVLSTFFITASFLMYVAYPQKRKYLIYVLLAIIGIFAKETIPMLVILLFAYIILFEEKMSLSDIYKKGGIVKIGRTVGKLLPLIILVAVVQVYVLSRTAEAPQLQNIPTSTLGEGESIFNRPFGILSQVSDMITDPNRLLTQFYVWFHYFRSFFLPYGLSADTDLGIIHNSYDDRLLIGVLFVVALIIAIFKTSKKTETKPIAFGLIWFVASLLPTSLVPLSEVMNDHRMYFAFVGLALSVVSALGLFVIKRETFFKSQKNYRILFASVCFIMGFHAYGVVKRNQVWDTEKSLWKDVTEKSPNNGRGWMNYGNTLMAEADFTGAIESFKKAEKTTPYYNILFINYGIAYGAIGKHEEAISSYEKGIKYAPNNYLGYVHYARYLLKKGEIMKAKELIQKAVVLNDTSQKVLETAMRVYQVLGMWEELEIIAKRSLELLPNDPKALAYLESAQKKEVIKGSTNVSDLINLSLSQYNNRDYQASIATCEKALKIDPNSANAYNNICAAYNMMQQWEKALEACKKAVELDPNHPNAAANLRWSESELNK